MELLCNLCTTNRHLLEIIRYSLSIILHVFVFACLNMNYELRTMKKDLKRRWAIFYIASQTRFHLLDRYSF